MRSIRGNKAWDGFGPSQFFDTEKANRNPGMRVRSNVGHESGKKRGSLSEKDG